MIVNENFTTEMNNSSFVVVKTENLTELYLEIKNLKNELSNLKVPPMKTVYNNTEIKGLLGIQDKLLKKYRDEGLLGFSLVGDKYWYTQNDVEKFLANTHQDAYAYAS